MEYSIRELARLSGTTTRALRWYDRIGLLKPCRVGENGYRRYGPAEVDRLQDILYYRALGVELSRIRDCLDAPSFDRPAALRSHLEALERERDRLNRLIRSVEDTLRAEERSESMNDEEKFAAFREKAVAENEVRYGAESREKYGDAAVDAAALAQRTMTAEAYEEWTGLDRDLRQGLERAVEAGLDPEGEEGKRLTALHRRWLDLSGVKGDGALQRGIAALYTEDGRFTAYYDGKVAGCARFLRKAVEHWAK